MNSWHSYPKVYALGHSAINGIMDGEVVIQEKIDGSQISFGVFNGVLKCMSRRKEQDILAPDNMFIQAIKTIQFLSPKLKNGWIYRGEYLQKPKHNTLVYSRVPNKHIILFDINNGNEHYLCYNDLKAEAMSLDLEVVPQYAIGNNFTYNDFVNFLETESILGKSKIEGIVIKNFNKFCKDGKVMMGKFVSEKFKEANQKTHLKAKRKDIIEMIKETYRTEARWEKAIQHLKEKGELTETPQDIGNLIKEVNNDIKEECIDEISNILFKFFWNDIQKGIIRGLPEWYKEKLAKKSFKES